MIVADSSSFISLAMNCLSKVFPKLGVRVYVTPAVRREMIERPMNIKRFALEAYRIKALFDNNTVAVSEPDAALVEKITDAANNIYKIDGKPLKIIHAGEAEALALVKQHDAEALLIDERTTRLLMEDPRELKNLLEFRMETRVKIDEGALSRFNEIVPRVPVIRSTEVAYIALERGLIEELAAGRREHCIESLLSALKFSGCSINWKEIDEYKKSVAA